MNQFCERETTRRPTSIFGTDGIRDRPGTGYLEPASLCRIAQAASCVAERSRDFPEDYPRGAGRLLVLGRDTRSSGPEIAHELAEAFLSLGWDVAEVGVLPSAGVAFLTSVWEGVALGVVVSASHNPATYNGVKFFAPTGAKVSAAFETAVSEAFWARTDPPAVRRAGRLRDRREEGYETYVQRLVASCKRPERLRGRKVAVDGANGSAFRAAPDAFRRLGLCVEELFCAPDGSNINEGCGALYPQALGSVVRERGLDFGFSFDGDADRAIAVGRSGRTLHGDHMLLMAGKSYLREGRLPRKTVVATVMSNLGLELALRDCGISLARTDVGDRAVYLEMVRGGHPVGGEQSGHIIFLDWARTGDGILSAIRCLDMVERDDLDLEKECADLRLHPQVLRNVPVPAKPDLETLGDLASAVENARRTLGERGRVLLRYSGTEPVLRVMVEGPHLELVEQLSATICECVERSLPV